MRIDFGSKTPTMGNKTKNTEKNILYYAITILECFLKRKLKNFVKFLYGIL